MQHIAWYDILLRGYARQVGQVTISHDESSIVSQFVRTDFIFAPSQLRIIPTNANALNPEYFIKNESNIKQMVKFGPNLMKLDASYAIFEFSCQNIISNQKRVAKYPT